MNTLKDTLNKIIIGIFVFGLFNFNVVYSNIVTTNKNEVTYYNDIAFLAHNNLAGDKFFYLKQNDYIYVIYNDYTVDKYIVKDILMYKTIEPYNIYTDFIDINGNIKTTEEIYKEIFKHPIVLQTCIEYNNIPTWGRLFIITYREDVRVPE